MIAAAHNGDDDEPDEESGGRGQFVSGDPHRIRGELAMIATAVKRRWEIDEEKRKKLAAEVLNTTLNAADPEIKFKGASIIVRMEGQNQADELAFLRQNKTVKHEHTVVVNQLEDGDLARIINGTFESPGSEGIAGTPEGEAEPA